MKKHLVLLTALFTTISSLHGSGILKTKTENSTPAPKKPAAPPKNLHPYCNPENTTNRPNIGFSVSYLGGAFGPSEMPIATDGVPHTAGSSLPGGSLINVPLNWSSGVNVNCFFSRDSIDGPLLFIDYRFLLGTNQTGGLSYPASIATTAPMISSYPLLFDLGEVTRVYSANGRYDNKGAQTGTVLVGRSLLQKGSTSLFLASGLSVYYIDHQLTINYSVNDGITAYQLYTLTQLEHRISGGPEIRFLARKSLTSSFGLDTMFGMYGHLAYFGNQDQATYQVTSTGPITYPYGTYGSSIRMIPGFTLSLGSYYTCKIKNQGSLTFKASWDGGFEPSGTFVASPAVGSSAFNATLMGYALLNVGATYIF